MRKYWLFFIFSWKQTMQYRLDFIFGRMIGLVALVTTYFLWSAVFEGRAQVIDYNLAEILTYVVGVALLYNIIFMMNFGEINREINEGVFASYLVKPIHYAGLWLARALGFRTLSFITWLGFMFIFVYFSKIEIVWQKGFYFLSLFGLSLILAIFMAFLLDFLNGISSFWLWRSRGTQWVFFTIFNLSAGVWFPINALPQSLQTVLNLTPFPYLIYFPLRLYLGKLSNAEIIQAFAVMSFWLVALVFIFYYAWRKGLRRYEGEGV